MQIMRSVKEWKISDRTCVSHLKYQPILIIMMLMQPNYGCIDSPIRMQMRRNHFWLAKSKVGTLKKSTNHSPFTMQTVQVCTFWWENVEPIVIGWFWLAKQIMASPTSAPYTRSSIPKHKIIDSLMNCLTLIIGIIPNILEKLHAMNKAGNRFYHWQCRCQLNLHSQTMTLLPSFDTRYSRPCNPSKHRS